MKKINLIQRNGCFVILLAGVLFAFTSCEKKWKKTTTVNFEFAVTPTTGHDFLFFSTGHMSLKQFSFSGTRQRGSNVEFNSTLPEGTQINLSSFSPTTSAISYDIPQGVYNDIDVKIEVSHSNAGNAKIYMVGMYKKDSLISYPVIFEINASELFDVQAQSADGSKEIVLVEDKPSRALVSFDMSYWFGNVTKSMLENAVGSGNTGATVFINNQQNAAIYDLVIGRIKNSCKIIFL